MTRRTSGQALVPRVRGRGWAYTGALLGGAVSIAANVAHSFVPPPGRGPDWSPPAGAVALSTFWPVFLFVAVEILARTPWPAGARWVVLRYVGLLPVAVVAAWVSYRHLSGLMTWYGEDHLTAMLGPLAVDGLMVMASGALVAAAPNQAPTQPVEPVEPVEPVDPVDPVERVEPTALVEPAEQPTTSDAPGLVQHNPPPAAPPAPQAAGPTAGPSAGPSAVQRPSTTRARGTATAANVARLRERHPDWTHAQLADKAGVSVKTISRHLKQLDEPDQPDQPTNTHHHVADELADELAGELAGDVAGDVAGERAA